MPVCLGFTCIILCYYADKYIVYFMLIKNAITPKQSKIECIDKHLKCIHEFFAK